MSAQKPNFLPAILILAGIVLLVWSAVHWRQTLALWRRHWALVLVCLCLTVFTVSNVVTANGATLFTLPLPHALVRLATTPRRLSSQGRSSQSPHEIAARTAAAMRAGFIARRSDPRAPPRVPRGGAGAAPMETSRIYAFVVGRFNLGYTT